MLINKLKPYALAAGIGLAGFLVAGTAKAEGLTPSKIEQIAQETKAPDNPAGLLTPKPAKKEETPAYKDPLEWLIVGSEIGASIFAATFIHETGHVITATALGQTVYDFNPTPHKSDGILLMGSVSIDNSGASRLEKIAIAAGGMATTRLTAEILDGFMNYAEAHPKGDLSPRAKQALAALYFMNRLDAPRYILRCAIPTWLGQKQSSTSDPQRIIELLTIRKKRSEERGRPVNYKVTAEERFFYAAATTLVVLDTILDWDEIQDNWDRLWMFDTEKEEKKDYKFNLDFLDDGVQARFSYTF